MNIRHGVFLVSSASGLLRLRWWLPWIPHGKAWLLPQPPQPMFFWLNHFVAVHTSSWWTFCWATWESERCCARRPIKNGTGALGHHRCISRRLFRSSMDSGDSTNEIISHCTIVIFPTLYDINLPFSERYSRVQFWTWQNWFRCGRIWPVAKKSSIFMRINWFIRRRMKRSETFNMGIIKFCQRKLLKMLQSHLYYFFITIVWLIDWLIESAWLLWFMCNSLIDWLIDWSFNCLIDWLIDWLFDWL